MSNNTPAPTNQPAERRAGRPPSERVHRAVLAATMAELAARGYAGLTLAAIARRARVSRQTLHNRWRAKSDLALEALLEHGAAEIPVPAEMSAAALERFFTRTFAVLRGPTGPILRELMAAAQLDPGFRMAFRERLVHGRREVLAGLLWSHGLRDPSELAFVLDLAYGVLWYRLLAGHAPLDRTLARRLAQLIAGAVPPRAARRR